MSVVTETLTPQDLRQDGSEPGPCGNATIVFLHLTSGEWSSRREAGSCSASPRISSDSLVIGWQVDEKLPSSGLQFLRRWQFLGVVSLRTSWMVLTAQVPPPPQVVSHVAETGVGTRRWLMATLFHAWNRWKKPMAYTQSFQLQLPVLLREVHMVLNDDSHGWEMGRQAPLLPCCR